MTVLLTGADGRIGSSLMQLLPSCGWTLRPFDGDIRNGDDLDRSLDAADSAAAVDAIVHLAGQSGEAPWPVIREHNIDGTYAVFEAARRHGVPRVVYASSNHAVGFTPYENSPASAVPDGGLPADLPPRPDTLYGVSKVFGEALGRYYADRYGLHVACLRIGTFAEHPEDVRTLSTWLSPADCAGLVDACLRAPGLGYRIVWGVSANSRRRWSLAAGRELGYEPRDDAEDYASEVIIGEPDPSDAFVGGGFTSAGFGIDEVAARR